MNEARIIRFTRRHPSARLVGTLETHLQRGGAAILPSETQYALSAVATDAKSVAMVRRIKGRRDEQPFSVFLYDRLSLGEFGIVLPDWAESLAEAFWPGPMTLVLPTRERTFRLLGGDGRNVGVRVSPEPLLAQLCRRLGAPLIATSANPSGLLLSARAENHWLMTQVEAHKMIWARPARYRRHTPSTVLDCTGRRVRVLRDGAIPARIWRQALASDRSERVRLDAAR